MKGASRAALYIRVSTREQRADTQEGELRRWADRLGLEVVRVYADTASGARSDRAALTAVLADAHRREFDALLISRVARLLMNFAIVSNRSKARQVNPESIRLSVGFCKSSPRNQQWLGVSGRSSR
jgi:DNA invertase Pin-like site-specific DNA recombinase